MEEIKIEIIGQALVITDTITGDILFDVPKGDYYYESDALENFNQISFYNLDLENDIKRNSKKYDLSIALDVDDNPFTKNSFISFCRNNLGFRNGGSSGGGTVGTLQEVTQEGASTNVVSTFSSGIITNIISGTEISVITSGDYISFIGSGSEHVFDTSRVTGSDKTTYLPNVNQATFSVFGGAWDATANTFANTDTGKAGAEWLVTVAGSVDFGAGSIDFNVGDILSNDGSVYYKKVNNGQVSLPSGEVGYGTGTGLTSTSSFTVVGNVLTMGLDRIDRLDASGASGFNESIHTFKSETSSNTFVATDYARVDRDDGSGTLWGKVLIVNDNSDVANTSGGTVGSFVQVDKEAGSAQSYVYGRETTVRLRGTGSVDFLNGHTLRVEIDGGSPTVNTVVRGISPSVDMDAAGATINGDLQVMHPTLNLRRGDLNADAQVILLDIDYLSGVGATIDGDISYIRAGNDTAGLTLNSGTIRFIDYRGSERSDFGGLIYMNQNEAAIEGATNGNVLINRDYLAERNVDASLGEITIPVGGLYTFELDDHNFFEMTLTENSTFTIPALDNGTARIFEAIVTGAFSLTINSSVITPDSDTYDGAVSNMIIFDCYRTAAGTQINNVTIRNLA